MTRHIAGALVVLAIAALPGSAQQADGRLASVGRTWRCDVAQKWECELPGGCGLIKPTPSWVLLDFVKRTYQRCDTDGCDAYAMLPHERGIFTYVTLPEHPDMFLKIGLAGLFVEVAARGVSAYNSLGTCKVQR
jgi:hypothetical protein